MHRLTVDRRWTTKRAPAVAGAVGFIVAWLIATGLVPQSIPAGFDSIAYWLVDPANPYTAQDYAEHAGFYYPPAAAQVAALLNWMPWEWFLVAWGTLMAATFVALAGPWAPPLLLLVPTVAVMLLAGNAEMLILLAAAAGFRHPWAWAFPLLTKVTPGIGLLWFAVRREWRSLGVALGATAAIVALSFALAPELWSRWIGLLVANEGALPTLAIPIPLLPRLVAAALLVAWGARTDRPQTVVVAAWLAQPVLWGYGVIVALPAFVDWRRLPLPGRATSRSRPTHVGSPYVSWTAAIANGVFPAGVYRLVVWTMCRAVLCARK